MSNGTYWPECPVTPGRLDLYSSTGPVHDHIVCTAPYTVPEKHFRNNQTMITILESCCNSTSQFVHLEDTAMCVSYCNMTAWDHDNPDSAVSFWKAESCLSGKFNEVAGLNDSYRFTCYPRRWSEPRTSVADRSVMVRSGSSALGLGMLAMLVFGSVF